MTVRTILLWPALKRAPKYRQLAELQDQLDWTAYALGIKLSTVAMPSPLKKIVTLGMRMRDPEDLTRGVQPFILGQYTAARRKSAAISSKQYYTVVGGGAAPSIANADVLSAPDGMYLTLTFIQARGQLTRTRVIHACLFGENYAIVGMFGVFCGKDTGGRAYAPRLHAAGRGTEPPHTIYPSTLGPYSVLQLVV